MPSLYRSILITITVFTLLLTGCYNNPAPANTRKNLSNSSPTPPGISSAIPSNSTALKISPTPVFVEVSNDPLTAELDQYIPTTAPLFSGVVLVAHDGRILLNRGYKYSNWEQETLILLLRNTGSLH
jgi:hypothetical protein